MAFELDGKGFAGDVIDDEGRASAYLIFEFGFFGFQLSAGANFSGVGVS